MLPKYREDEIMNARHFAAGPLAKVLLVFLLCGLFGCGQSEQEYEKPKTTGESAMKLTIQSSAFVHGEPIPRRYSGEGEELSVPLSWSGLGEGVKELALIVDDPDVPRPDPDAPRAEPWVHWVIYKIPAEVSGLAEGIAAEAELSTPVGALQGKNTSGGIGYQGPMPPLGHGVHHYHFKLYALDTQLELKAGADKQALLAAMEGHVVGQSELVGTYQR